jgi:micrococcal nuclease
LAVKRKSIYVMSRKQRAGITMLCLLLAAFFVWFDKGQFGDGLRLRLRSKVPQKIYDVEKYHSKIFNVIYVVDGDTIDIDVPDDQEHNHTRIRLWGVDTPETKNPETGIMYYGPEAAEYARKLVYRKSVTIYLDTLNNTRDKYDRLLAYVQLPDGRFLNEVLLSEGFAYADVRFRHSFYNKYKQLEAGARNHKKGLWEKVKREQLPEWLKRERPNLLFEK